MSENRRDIREEFESIVSRNMPQDPMIKFMNHNIRTVEEGINEGEVSASQALEALNDAWDHYNSLVKISGRIYVRDGIDESQIPKEWGEPIRNGNVVYYNVEDAVFESRGISDYEMGVPGRNGWTETKLGYGLSSVNFDEDNYYGDKPPFVAIPDDVFADFGNAIDIYAQLHSEYPELMAEIDSAIQPTSDDKCKQLIRLQEIIRRTEEIAPQCQGRLSNYIGKHLNLDYNWQYIFRVDGPIEVDDMGEYKEVFFEGPFEFAATVLRVDIPYDSEGEGSQLGVLLSVPPGRDGQGRRDSEVMVPVSSLAGMRSTRPKKSIIDQIRKGRIEKVEEASLASGVASVEMVQDERLDRDHQPSQQEIAIDNQHAIDQIRSLAKQAEKPRYNSEEEARAKAIELKQKIAGIFITRGLVALKVKVTGDIIRTNLNVESESEDGGSIKVSIDQNGFIMGHHSAIFEEEEVGFIYDAYTNVEPILTDGGHGPNRWRVKCNLLVRDEGYDSLSLGRIATDLAMDEVVINRKFIVDLCRPNEIKSYEYAGMMKRKERYDELEPKLRGEHEAKKIIKSLDQALSQGVATNFKKLKDVKLLRKLADYLEYSEQSDTLVSFTEALFIGRPQVRVAGLSALASGDVPHTRGLNGTFVGISLSHPENDDRIAYMVVQANTGENYYVDMSSILHFEF